MKPILSRAQMRAFDAHAIERCHVPGIVLMENAGRLAADAIVDVALAGDARGASVVVVCGAGNNGGDGFVVARHLLARGAAVRAFLVGASAARVKGDARANLDAFVGVGGALHELAAEADLAPLDEAIGGARVVVDALFGTGLDRPIVGQAAEAVAKIGAARATRVAIDVPSGLDADTGAPLGACVTADLTITFGHPKLGLLTPHGARVVGELRVVDLGVPPSLDPARSPAARLIEREDAARLFPPRARDVHKHAAGHVCVFGGSDGKVGAALMVARGALRAGAGLATIATWPESTAVLQSRVTEEMTTTLARDRVDESVAAAIAKKRAVVVGPGFGLDEPARRVCELLLATWKGPALFDADALTIFAGRPEAFAALAIPAVLTPHSGELARLLGTSSDAVDADRHGAARELARRAHAIAVLKGAFTIVAHPDGRVVVCPSGGPALATAGAGDTLSGIIGALLCTRDPFEAAWGGVYVHGLAADAWSREHGDRGLLASEIADRVPRVLGALSREHTRGPV